MRELFERMKSTWSSTRSLMRRDRKFRYRIWAITLLVLANSVLFIQIMSQKPEAPDLVPSGAWAYGALASAQNLPFSELAEMVRDADADDRIAVMNYKIVLAKSYVDAASGSADSPDHTTFYASDLNARSYDVMRDMLLKTEASLSFIGDPPATLGQSFRSFLADMFPMIIIIAILILLVSGRLGMLGKGAHKVVSPDDIDVCLDDVAGIDDARDDIREVIGLMTDEKGRQAAGGRLPRGILLSGPPGNGKTLLAKAMAREAGVSFLSVDASALNELYMGTGALRIRRAFAAARKNLPCIVFMDEIDAVGSRSGDASNLNGEKATTINALLVELDGLGSTEGLFVIGATNLPERLDPAIIRPGRIDRRIHISTPDMKGRQEMLRIHTRNVRLSPEVDLAVVAKFTPGQSGADIAALCNEAALKAGREGRSEVTLDDFRAARDRMLIGQNGGAIVLDDEERQVTAWHEAGHALVAALLPNTDPIDKVTILPRGGALGFVLQVPEKDRRLESKARIRSRMKILAAGRAAEILRFGEDNVTTGAASDIEVLTRYATHMVIRWGMGREGFVDLSNVPDILQQESVRQEIRDIASETMGEAMKLLKENREKLDAIASELLEKDVISGDDVRRLAGDDREDGRQILVAAE